MNGVTCACAFSFQMFVFSSTLFMSNVHCIVLSSFCCLLTSCFLLWNLSKILKNLLAYLRQVRNEQDADIKVLLQILRVWSWTAFNFYFPFCFHITLPLYFQALERISVDREGNLMIFCFNGFCVSLEENCCRLFAKSK